MKNKSVRDSKADLLKRLEASENVLESLRRGELDIIIGEDEPLLVQLKSLAEKKEKLHRLTRQMAKDWETTFHSTQDAICVLDRDQKIVRSNRTAERLFGRPAESMVGRHYWEIVYGSDGPVPDCPFLRSTASLKRESLEIEIGSKWFEIHVDPILNEKGEFDVASLHACDITERKRAEIALLESKRELSLQIQIARSLLWSSQSIFDKAALEIISHAIDSESCWLIYREKNGELKHLFAGTGDDEIDLKGIGKTPGERIGFFRQILENKANSSFSLCGKPSIGGPVLVAVPFQNQERHTGILLVARKNRNYHENEVRRLTSIADYIAPILNARLDQSWVEAQRSKVEKEKALLEEQYYQAQKMESIGRLAGGVAHDFSNMLSIIIGYGENLLYELQPDDPIREDIREIVEAGRKSAGLIRQLLAFSRRQTLHPEVIDINRILQNLEKMLARMVGEDVEVKFRLAGDLWKVEVDCGQFEQVIMNLAVNARDAMPHGGILTIETANTVLEEPMRLPESTLPSGRYVVIRVSDTGRGMDKEIQPMIFEPFFTTKEEGKGTGLGLSTVYGIIKQSRGNIRVYSQPGRGTQFEIILPEAKVESIAEAEQNRLEEAPQGGNEHILIVEDDPALRKLVERVLVRLGYIVMTASSSEEAIQLIQEKDPRIDLVITDIVMPGMSGLELVNYLSELRPGTKALYMSGYSGESITTRGGLNRDAALIQKPISLRKLAEMVREALAR